MRTSLRAFFALTCVLLALTPTASTAASSSSNLPRIVERDGRYAILVDGAPYLILGAQTNNSSDWPSMLPKVWPAISYINANTVETPVYWEQIEPVQGHFEFGNVDTVVDQAREHHVHLILLWFGTWKNGSAHYIPLWMKSNHTLYPYMIRENGLPIDSPSPFAPAALEADKTAFSKLMGHLKVIDPQHTVIMIQVENETGTWGSVRDYSPIADTLFDGPVPAKLLHALNLSPSPAADTWQDVFGTDAEVDFHAWSVASYVGTVAAAGKAVYPLPMYCNASLRDPSIPPPAPGTYESGGPTDNVISIWKAAAPAIDMECPDIYINDSTKYLRVLDQYSRPDNPLYVPETGSGSDYARFFFAALGHGSMGFSPFGIDFTGSRISATDSDGLATWLGDLQQHYALFEPMDREIARLNFEGRVKGVCEDPNVKLQSLTFGPWTATVSYSTRSFGGQAPVTNPTPVGGALIAQLSESQFLVTGYHCRVDFHVTDPNSTKQRAFVRVYEGSYNGTYKFTPIRIWNGDQTDFGLAFSSQPQVLQVNLGTY